MQETVTATQINSNPKRILFLAAVFFSACCALPRSSFAARQEYIRVAILQDAPSFNLKINGFFEVIDPKTKKVLSRGKQLKTLVQLAKGAISIGQLKGRYDRLLIKTFDADIISIDGRLFRDNLELIRKDNSRLLVVNRVNVEDYVKGILYHEASHYWPEEALKAQAVACRTYALYQAAQGRGKDFDLTNDIYSQVYGGRTSERFRTSKAVDETEGKALYYRGELFPAYFHATCAGHTESASELWNTDIAPLKGVACGWCKESPHFKWHYVVSLSEVRKKLNAAGRNIGRIKSVEISGRDNSGRAADLKIISADQESKISAKDFRGIIGPNLIRSLNFNLEIADNDLIFEGIGWGHGVGMCQWGAYFMAKQGKNFSQILEFYYPGSEIK